MNLLASSVFVTLLVLLPRISQGNPIDNRSESKDDAGALGIPANVLEANDKDLVQVGEEKDGPIKERQKRLSDQRRAELETLMTLSKMTGKLVGISRGGRQLDPAKLGRRKRSVPQSNLKILRGVHPSRDLIQKGDRAYPLS